jgi:lambda repressor-like predicted transcriptional regulator
MIESVSLKPKESNMLKSMVMEPDTFTYQTRQDSPRFEYTQEGLQRLSLLIRASLEYRNWSIRKLAREAGIAASTIIRYKNAEASPPDEKLKLIAPFIYKPVSITENTVKIDTQSVFADWEELAALMTND